MPKAAKSTLAPAAPETITTSGATPTAYPEVTEARSLKTYLNDKEKRDASLESARLVQEISGLEEDKKASASDYKARIEGRQARQTHLARLVIDGWEDRSIKCEWRFECAGLDDSGKPIYHPEQKCLVRTDTNEVVEVTGMMEADFQRRELALGDKDKAKEGEETSGEGSETDVE